MIICCKDSTWFSPDSNERFEASIESKLLFSQSNTISSMLLEEESDKYYFFTTNSRFDFIALSLITYVLNHEDKHDERISSESLSRAHRERENNGSLDSS